MFMDMLYSQYYKEQSTNLQTVFTLVSFRYCIQRATCCVYAFNEK